MLSYIPGILKSFFMRKVIVSSIFGIKLTESEQELTYVIASILIVILAAIIAILYSRWLFIQRQKKKKASKVKSVIRDFVTGKGEGDSLLARLRKEVEEERQTSIPSEKI